MAKCKSCGATINFLTTENGKMMPVESGVTTIITRQGQTLQGFIPHWSKCPKADTHRKKNR